MKRYRYRDRLVHVKDGRVVRYSAYPVTTGVLRGLAKLPRPLRPLLQPQGWEGEAMVALAARDHGDREAVIEYAEKLSDRGHTVPRTDQGVP